MVNVILSLVGSNGDEIVFDNNGDFLLTEGLTGIGIPDTQVRFADSASDGGVWRFTKRGIREIDMPLMILGSSNTALEANLRRLSNLLQDRRGATKLRASYPNGEVWELQDGHYVSGATTTLEANSNGSWTRWAITMQFANPFWIRERSESFSLGTGGAQRSLIPTLAEMEVTGSQVIGDITIENVGDCDAYPVWKVRGPVDSVTITSQDGLSFSYDAIIPLGSEITIDTANGTVVDQNGVNKYANLGASPKLFTLPAGTSEVFIEAVGSDQDTLVSLYYQPRKEVVH